MVGPVTSAAQKVVAKKVASKKAAGQAANGVKNAKISTGLRQTTKQTDKRLLHPVQAYQKARLAAKKLGTKDTDYFNLNSKPLLQAALVTVRPIVLIASPIQLFGGILTIVTYSFWTSLESWTWGISDYVIPGETIFGIVWIFTIVIGLFSLFATALILTLIGQLPIFNRPITFGSFLVLFALAILPFTSFLPSAGLFSFIVFLVFIKS